MHCSRRNDANILLLAPDLSDDIEADIYDLSTDALAETTLLTISYRDGPDAWLADLPKYVIDPLQRQSAADLRQIAAWCEELAEHRAVAPGADEVPDREADESVTAEDESIEFDDTRPTSASGLVTAMPPAGLGSTCGWRSGRATRIGAIHAPRAYYYGYYREGDTIQTV